MPLTLVSVVACRRGRLADWRPEDYSAYKVLRLLGGRRIAGSAWLPRDAGSPQRISNAHRDLVVSWFVDRVAPYVRPVGDGTPRVVLVPFPDPGRVVGAPPSRSRLLAQALADRSGLRVLDILRWRQPMPRCRALGVQTLADNLVTTGSVVQTTCILVAECVSSGAGLQAAASQLRRYGGDTRLSISAGRAGEQREPDPFTTALTELDDVATADL